MSFPDGYFFIQSVFSGKVLDIDGASTQPGAAALLWDRKDADNDNQLWMYQDGALINKKSGLALEVSGATGGGNITPKSRVVQNNLTSPPESINQLWAYNYEYIMPYDPKVGLSALDGKFENGTAVVVDVLVDFPNNPQQQWVLATA